ncbi:hypothetical protein [Rhizobacter fulvus]
METNPTWLRLHPESSDDTLAIAVQARIHDPLWLLGRQWQFNELRHDAGATPVDVRVEGTSSPLSRLRGGPVDAVDLAAGIATGAAPLEALVEREPVKERTLEDLRLRTESGQHLLRLLRAAGMHGRTSFWIAASPFAAPADAGMDDPTRRWFDLVEGRVPDGGGLEEAIHSRLAAGSAPPIAEDEAAVLRTWLAWASSRFDAPASGPSTWDPEHVEYAFGVAGMGATGEVVLAAPEYVEGRLDWHAFEQVAGTLGTSGQATPRRHFRIPAPLDFAGMPNPRFWTFEDSGVRFEALDLLSDPSNPPSAATLMVLDFALSYSDDWFLVPLALEAWSLFETTAVAITDVFGDTTLAQPPAGRWNMFRLESAAPAPGLSTVFLAAAPIAANEGPALEEVHFLRDEVANVAWAVERITPHPLGYGSIPMEEGAQASLPTPSGLIWRLTPPPLPGNWFPLLPSTIGRLALGALWSTQEQRPSGRVLVDLQIPRQLHQEEVPPEGVQVVRRWQSARGLDGSLHFWVGRSKTPRRTDIAPGVRFDTVDWN